MISAGPWHAIIALSRNDGAIARLAPSGDRLVARSQPVRVTANVAIRRAAEANEPLGSCVADRSTRVAPSRWMRAAHNKRRAIADAESGVPQATSRTPPSTHRCGSPMTRLARDGGLPKRRAQAACTRGVDLRRARTGLPFVTMPFSWLLRRGLKKRTPFSHAAGPSGVQPPGARGASGHPQRLGQNRSTVTKTQ